MSDYIDLRITFDRDVQSASQENSYARAQLALDVEDFLKREDWGWGRAHITSVDPLAQNMGGERDRGIVT